MPRKQPVSPLNQAISKALSQTSSALRTLKSGSPPAGKTKLTNRQRVSLWRQMSDDDKTQLAERLGPSRFEKFTEAMRASESRPRRYDLDES